MVDDAVFGKLSTVDVMGQLIGKTGERWRMETKGRKVPSEISRELFACAGKRVSFVDATSFSLDVTFGESSNRCWFTVWILDRETAADSCRAVTAR